MEEQMQNKKSKYFAAANSYRGFVSYFDQIFSSDDYDRIYVIKGGPGTGKSSLMKRISGHLIEKSCKIEEIYCSSDPNSLDGIIAEKGNKRIAMIDGTAPHERDAVIAGAIDEIINLADSWDSRWLIEKRNEILSLTKEKSQAYKTAYSYLKIAGEANDFILSTYRSFFDISKAKNKAEEIFSDITCCEVPKIITRLVSSFGKNGEYNLDTLEAISKRKISVYGNEASSCIFLTLCAKMLNERGASFINLPLALEPRISDAVYVLDSDIAVVRSERGEINADDFLTQNPLSIERVKKAQEIKKDSLLEGQRWFAIASDLHFRLEEIYSSSMDFTKNDNIFVKTIAEIENILEIKR